jgi:hypothetical protein
MKFFVRRRLAAAIAVLGAVVPLAAGCAAQPSSNADTPTAPADAPAAVASLIDARWMGFDTTAPWNWEDIERRITPDFQEFGFRPVGEWRGPRPCQGCGERPATAEVKIYAPGKFDAAVAQQGRRVEVNGGAGFFLPMGDHPFPGEKDEFDDAILTWQYADDAWATARGMSTMTGEVDRLQELARALRPAERTPIRLPLSLANVPTGMPLTAIKTEYVPIGDSAPYGTRLSFAPCAYVRKGDDCTKAVDETGSMSVFIWPRDDYDHSIDRISNYVAWRIGGRDGRYSAKYGSADVLVQKGMYVKFSSSTPRDAEPDPTRFQHVLDSVGWAPDPGNEATWPVVGDWAKQ